MSTYGISTKIPNRNGEIVIDQNFACIEVFDEGTITSRGGGYDDIFELNYSGILRPIVFVKMVQNVRYWFGPTENNKMYLSSNAGNGSLIEYKLCGVRENNTTIPTGYGTFINKKGTNEVAFSSTRKYLRMFKSFQVTDSGYQVLNWPTDSWDFDTDNNGLIYRMWFYHNSNPVPFNTYWLASATGLAARPNSVNSTPWVISRRSQTDFEFIVDGIITRPNRERMRLADPTGIKPYITRLVAF